MTPAIRYAVLAALLAAVSVVKADTVIEPKVTLTDRSARDQDDMCIWRHPSDPRLSTVIASDKAARKLFVYDLKGRELQTVRVVGKPGNVDLRYGIPFGGKDLDVVAFNERNGSSIHVYGIEPVSRRIARIDDRDIETEPNYGFTLYVSSGSGKLYGFTTPGEDGTHIEQHELRYDGRSRVTGTKVRSWEHGMSEGCVADDATGALYVAEEDRGIWKFQAEPDAPTDGELIAAAGANGLTADVEGLAICRDGKGQGFLIASSQGSSQFKVYRLKPPHEFVASFSVEGAAATDGIDALNADLGSAFPNGIFTLHNGKEDPCPVLICDVRDIGPLAELSPRDPRDK